MNDRELKQWCIDKAIESGSDNVVNQAQNILNFIEAAEASKKVANDPKTVERQWSATGLTASQKAVMTAMIKRYNEGQRINGTLLAEDLKMTQGNCSAHLRKLIKLKYVGREGNRYWPQLTPSGKPLPVQVVKCPPANAKGIKPLAEGLKAIAGGSE